MKRAIVFRFSAMGDVALVMATLKTIISENNNLEITVVTRAKFKPFFDNQPNIQVFTVDFDKKYKSIDGLFRLFLKLKNIKPDYILDLHQNLRTQILKLFFRTTNTKIFTIDKGRSEKKKLTSNKSFKPLRHVTERYLDVFKKAELVSNNLEIWNQGNIFNLHEYENKPRQNQETLLIGIAPFAQHKGKIWPIQKFESLIDLIQAKYPDSKILLFGGGNEEEIEIEKICRLKENTLNMVGKYSLSEELQILQKLKVMISGDTSNMHLASLSGIPVVSIWGSTHTFAGFGALFQPKENTIEISKEKLECRPCSIYGNKPCFRKDYACLNWIDPETVFSRVSQILKD